MYQNNNKIEIFSPKKNNWYGLTITDSAANHINYLMTKDSKMFGLKINIKLSGCAGFTYVIEKATSLEDNYLKYENNNAKIYIPINVMPFIDGTELDYIQVGLNFMFKFNNPQAKFSCGCGDSFNL